MDRYADLPLKGKFLECARWLAVLPAALLAGIAAQLLTVIGNSPGCTMGMVNPQESLIDRLFVTVVSNGVMGVAAVVAGSKTAPRAQVTVALVIAVLYVLESGVIFIYLLDRPAAWWDYLALPIGAIGAAGGAAYCYSQARVQS